MVEPVAASSSALRLSRARRGPLAIPIDLRLPGNLCCGHLLALLQQEEDGRQPVGPYSDNTARKAVRK